MSDSPRTYRRDRTIYVIGNVAFVASLMTETRMVEDPLHSSRVPPAGPLLVSSAPPRSASTRATHTWPIDGPQVHGPNAPNE